MNSSLTASPQPYAEPELETRKTTCEDKSRLHPSSRASSLRASHSARQSDPPCPPNPTTSTTLDGSPTRTSEYGSTPRHRWNTPSSIPPPSTPGGDLSPATSPPNSPRAYSPTSDDNAPMNAGHTRDPTPPPSETPHDQRSPQQHTPDTPIQRAIHPRQRLPSLLSTPKKRALTAPP